MNQPRDVVTFEGKPYFLRQTDDGIYQAVKRINFESIESQIESNLDQIGNLRLNCEYDSKVGRLELGVDIEQEPETGLSLFVRLPKEEFLMTTLIQQCRKFAEFGRRKYFSLDGNYSPEGYKFIAQGDDDSYIFMEVVPKIFRDLSPAPYND